MEVQMEVLDIIQFAAFKSGVVPSFNPDELPGDVLDAGVTVLQNEILPALNCDRTLDITVTSRIYKPVNNRIVLYPLSQPRDNFRIVGYSQYDDTQLPSKMTQELQRFGIDTDNWPCDDLGNMITLALWSTNFHLHVKSGQYIPSSILPNVNIDFPPMRVDSVLENSSRIEYSYVYRDEFERAKPSASLPGLYAVEEYEDKIIILINGSNQDKCVILPVPLQIVNSGYDNRGSIIAPPKFKAYLIDRTAVALATIYGMSTLPIMEKAAAASYNLLKKNKTQPLHEANVNELILDNLRTSPLGRRFYAGK
jgi:hypothetical protein